jgi:hypothetical protein
VWPSPALGLEALCKPEVAGSIPARSNRKGPGDRAFSFSDLTPARVRQAGRLMPLRCREAPSRSYTRCMHSPTFETLIADALTEGILGCGRSCDPEVPGRGREIDIDAFAPLRIAAEEVAAMMAEHIAESDTVTTQLILDSCPHCGKKALTGLLALGRTRIGSGGSLSSRLVPVASGRPASHGPAGSLVV